VIFDASLIAEPRQVLQEIDASRRDQSRVLPVAEQLALADDAAERRGVQD
jgi:hypothetical protein